MNHSSIRRVLIYRLGSIGDTVVALPCLHLIARAFPNAERRLLTNFTTTRKTSGMAGMMGNTGLVHGYFRYRIGTRNISELWNLRNTIANWSPDLLIYLTNPRGCISVFRDALFFHLCGAHRQIGVPFLVSQQVPKKIKGNRLFESEAHRLARCIKSIGNVDLGDHDNWNLLISRSEHNAALTTLSAWSGKNCFISASIGTKIRTKYWGSRNWIQLFELISRVYPECGLLLIGSSDERRQSDMLSEGWSGPKLNLCGAVSPRISAAIMEDAILFIGHDSGPMHLAAAMQVPCVAIFSARNKPGEWFPYGKHHSILYKQTDCYGCKREICADRDRECIRSITVDEVFRKASLLLQASAKIGVQGPANPVPKQQPGNYKLNSHCKYTHPDHQNKKSH